MSPAGQDLYRRAKRRIPGGTQLLSKRPELFLPEQWPAYYRRARGAELWDLDGNRYLDMCYNGLGACVLGAADPDVDAAVQRALTAGSMSTLNCPEEVELAELLCELHPWAERVRYARTGGEAMALAVRLARAATGRDKLAFCGYHGWHDWYLAANLAIDGALDGHLLPGLAPTGVPRALADTAHPFEYNRLEQLEALVAARGPHLAAIVMEPVRNHNPEPGFLAAVHRLAARCGAVLIFDEITSGFRLCTGGAHLVYGVTPDIAVLGKALGNGYAMAAVIGRDSVMDAAQTSFISSTYWTERIGPTAALATILKHRDHRVAEHLISIGRQVQEGWRDAAAHAALPIQISGLPPLAHFTIRHADAQAAVTYFTQEMLKRGYLAKNAFYATYAHKTAHVERYLADTRGVFATLARALEQGRLRDLLDGPVAHHGFHRLT